MALVHVITNDVVMIVRDFLSHWVKILKVAALVFGVSNAAFFHAEILRHFDTKKQLTLFCIMNNMYE